MDDSTQETLSKGRGRRTFLKTASVAAVAFPFVKQFDSGNLWSESPINYRAIPSSKERLPVVGLGTWQQFDIDANSPERASLIEVLKNLKEKGGKVIDSSPMYGRAEVMVGELTQKSGTAESFFYATKVWTSGREEGIQQMEDSIRKMRRPVMDLMQVHNLVDINTHLKTLYQWKEENKIRYIGATHYATSAHTELERLVDKQKLDFLQFNFKIKEQNASKSLLPRALDKGVAVIINEPFASGSLFQTVRGKNLPEWASEWDILSWAQFFLKFILSHPAVTCVIPGTSNPKHILDNLGAGYGKIPDEAGRKKMAAYFASL